LEFQVAGLIGGRERLLALGLIDDAVITRLCIAYPMQSPYVAIAAKNAEIMIRIAAEFGFTPASRRRLPGPSKSNFGTLELLDLEDPKDQFPSLE
jgi:phage terminase small subunit